MYNIVFLLGWVGRAPETSQPGEAGKLLTRISLATKRYWRNLDGVKQEAVTWHTVEGWEGNAHILREVEAGDLIWVEGYIDNDTHAGKFHSTVVAQKVFRLNTAKQDGRLSRRESLVELARALDDHDWEVLLSLRKR